MRFFCIGPAALVAGLLFGTAVAAQQSDQLTLGVGSWETLRSPDRKPEVDLD